MERRRSPRDRPARWDRARRHAGAAPAPLWDRRDAESRHRRRRGAGAGRSSGAGGGMTLRVLIADDEPLARRGLRSWLATESDITVVAEARHGKETVALVRTHRPDLLFLDVQMPGLDGVGALAALGADAPTAVIFVTAYDQYALEAFDRHAVDYLLKPVAEDRFRLALGRARDRIAR